MNNPPRVVLLGKLSTRGESFHKALKGVCSVKWIARKSEFRTNPLLFPFHVIREFIHLLKQCQSVPEGSRPTVIVHSIGADTIPAFVATVQRKSPQSKGSEPKSFDHALPCGQTKRPGAVNGRSTHRISR